jgi:1-aminocyclopropane-1-carboxylate deaminase
MQHDNIRIDNIDGIFAHSGIAVDVLRLDLIHPLVSGNKWYKLKIYFQEAETQNKSTILTFGGAYSNHILATAAACKDKGFSSIGIMRGEEPKQYSNTLLQAQSLGMKLYFISRDAYKKKTIPNSVYEETEQQYIYLINEGGYGLPGRKGAESIMEEITKPDYTHILVAIGTGTTLAGLVAAKTYKQQVIGISVLKNNLTLSQKINALLPEKRHNQYILFHQFHFGGYAKQGAALINFMNQWFRQTGIPTDFVYTGKLFYAANELVNENYFERGSKLLIIHSGGIQGNHSLPNGTLIF